MQRLRHAGMVCTLGWGLLCAVACGGGGAGSGGERDAELAELELPRLSGARALEEVARFVAVGPRDSGTPGAERAAVYLQERMEEFGVEARIQAFEDASPMGEIVFRNVIGRIPGTGERILIFGSHYDTKAGMPEGFEGANDSGSSTGLLLEMGRLLQGVAPLPLETWLVFFDGEECMEQYGPTDGLHGSRYLARWLLEQGLKDRVEGVIILDMVGDRDLTVTLPRNGDSALTAMALQAAHDEGVRSRFGLSEHAILDDHVPFLRAGIPAVDLIDFEYGSAPGLNDHWHTAEDTLDKLSGESLRTVGDVALRMLEIIALGD